MDVLVFCVNLDEMKRIKDILQKLQIVYKTFQAWYVVHVKLLFTPPNNFNWVVNLQNYLQNMNIISNRVCKTKTILTCKKENWFEISQVNYIQLLKSPSTKQNTKYISLFDWSKWLKMKFKVNKIMHTYCYYGKI